MIKNILNFFKKNLYFILLSITVFLSSTIQMPYYIKTGGGLIDASQRFEIENTDNKESIYMAYVSEMKATPFSYLIAKIRKYDITKIEEKTYYNETEEDSFFRSKMLLEEANATAILVAYKAANKEVNVLNNELYVTYIDELANTDLEIGDQILQINNEKIDDKKNLYEIIKNYKSGDRINILVKNNDKEYYRFANIIEYENQNMIGIMVTEKKELETNPKIKIKFKNSESGSSGGLMMTLAIYNQLLKKSITNGFKISGTGTIDENGKVGEIAGVKYKLKGAVKEKADIFFVPNGDNYKEAIEEQKKEQYDIEIVGVDSFDDVLNYLN